MTGAERPALRVVSGGQEDAVVRRRRFEQERPEAVSLPPCAGRWRAVVLAGLIPGDGTDSTLGGVGPGRPDGSARRDLPAR